MRLDKSMFKGKDLGLVREIFQYFERLGIDIEIAGSVKENYEKGNPRSYRYIDLKVRYKESKGRSDALWGLIFGIDGIKDKSLGIPLFIDKVKEHDYGSQLYLPLDEVSNEFRIVNEKTNTLIRLCFEGKGSSGRRGLILNDLLKTRYEIYHNN